MSDSDKNLTCGLIMPISPTDGCGTEHWIEVKSIFTEALKSIAKYSFSIKLVSDADEIGMIHKRIVQNLYSSDLVICDVSGKNPNVMFELGLRLAFDKATIIVKDDKTNYSFDTGVIEHLEYPRDLRFSKIVEFKAKLANKALATYEDANSNPGYSTFLKNFGEFQVATLNEKEVSPDNIIIEMLSDVQKELSSLKGKVDTKYSNEPLLFTSNPTRGEIAHQIDPFHPRKRAIAFNKYTELADTTLVSVRPKNCPDETK